MIDRLSKIFVFPEAIDMRSGFEKLAFFVREKLRQELNHGNLVLFLGKNRRRLKIIYFDGSGLVLITKRLEKNQFMNIVDLKEKTEISKQELQFILHGSVLRKYKPDRAA